MKIQLLICCLLGAISFSSCKKDQATPACIEGKIIQRDKTLVSVKLYSYQEQSVYLFDFNAPCCDMIEAIGYDANCNSIVTSGGIAGCTGPCSDFYQNAKFQKQIWKK